MVISNFDKAEERYVNVNVNGIVVSGLKATVKIEKTTKPEPNKLDLVVYNLSEETRSKLQELAPKNGVEAGIPVQIEVGYVVGSLNEFTKNTYDSGSISSQDTSVTKDTDKVWYGDLRTVISYYDAPNWITRLTAGDGEKAAQVSKMNQTFGPNTPVDVVLRAIINKLNESLNDQSQISQANINKIISQVKMQGGGKLISSSVVLSGSAYKLLQDWSKSTDLEFSFQDGQIQLLNRRKALADTALEIVTASGEENSTDNLQTGVIGSVEVDDKGNVKFNHIIKPGFRPGRLIKLYSQRAEGFFKITKLNYSFDTFNKGDWKVTVEGERFG